MPRLKKSKFAEKVRKAFAPRIARRVIDRKVRRAAPPLERAEENPVIEPASRWWESKATFNPGAFVAGGKVYLLYRAIGDTDSSVLGFARSDDGVHIRERLDKPAYARPSKQTASIERVSLSPYSSGGGWNGGAEDPRLTLLGDTVYLLYTAFDGWSSLRIALASIPLADFKRKHWGKWSVPVFISPPGEINKNWVLFPEKVRGKYAILHSISPKVMVEYVDSLDEFDGTRFIDSRHGVARRKSFWDNQMRGVGPPPLKTKDGWLVLYHAMDRRDPDRYKLGAMLLDLEDPRKILYRAVKPVLEPDEIYENDGFKPGVVYSCGAAMVGGTLFVYYGGADKVTCVATADLKKFLNDLERGGVGKLKRASVLPRETT